MKTRYLLLIVLIAIYAVNNNGGWYNFGYIIGLGGFGFSSSKSSK